MGEYPHVRVSGEPRQRGMQYGEQARDRVRRSVGAYREVFATLAGWDWATVRAEAVRFEAPIAAFGPRYLDEMRGIADGAGLNFEDVLAINVRTEVMFAAKARQAALLARRDAPRDTPVVGGPAVAGPAVAGPAVAGPAVAGPAVAECSAFAVSPAPGQPGPAVLGQNWDWLPHSAETVVVLEARQDDGPDFVTVVEAGLLAKTGMNSSGLGLVTNALVTADDAGEPGLPYHVLLRAILDCHNVSDAIAVLQAGFRSSSANYLLAHADGAALNVEASPGDFSRLYFLSPGPDGVLLHTNHFLSSRFACTDLSVWVMPDSPVRLARLQAGVRAAGSAPSLATFRALLSDHANYPSGVCCHPDPRMPEVDQGMTVTSVLMDPGARRMWVSDGNPCAAGYRELDYSGLLAKPSPVRASEMPAPGPRAAA